MRFLLLILLLIAPAYGMEHDLKTGVVTLQDDEARELAAEIKALLQENEQMYAALMAAHAKLKTCKDITQASKE